MRPFVIVNFKTYREATGASAVRLARRLAAVGGKGVMLAVQAADISAVSRAVKVPVFAQHVDPFSVGRNTGFVLPESVKAAGAKGTLLNHAEHRIPFEVLKSAVSRCRRLGLKTVVCVPDVRAARNVLRLKPDFIAYESPELIGTGRSVSSVNPGKVRAFSSLFRRSAVVPLCGAGISSGGDVAAALELGAQGVLVASSVVRSSSPGKVLKALLEGGR